MERYRDTAIGPRPDALKLLSLPVRLWCSGELAASTPIETRPTAQQRDHGLVDSCIVRHSLANIAVNTRPC